ncbi:MAG: DUF1343 domain-containing protein [Candidatus Sericytochromatia bacterium]|nr:DUF1343 domain-containing protein [Candidatus Sericytochromatia bacterium]
MNNKLNIFLKSIKVVLLVSFLISANDIKVEAKEHVLTGLDILKKNNFSDLNNKRVGLITNHTAFDQDGNYILDIFSKQNKFKLNAIFTPEHGLRGKEDREFIPSETYQKDIPVYSLYNEIKKPTSKMLDNIDVLVYDIQDIGTRYYTFITTLAYCMEAAREKGIDFVVLDRPNPIGGSIIEGEVLKPKFKSFTGYLNIPTRYGMTVGEIANYYNSESHLNVNLKVIKMENWQRDMFYNQTGLKWINPSPNMRSVEAATVYPGLGMLETVNLSVGRGTSNPFIYYGAPWLDNYSLVKELNKKRFDGLKFEAIKFTPDNSTFTKVKLNGFKVIINDKTKVRSVDALIYALYYINKQNKGKLKYDGMNRSFGSSLLTEMLDGKYTPTQVLEKLKKDQNKFLSIRKKYLLY